MLVAMAMHHTLCKPDAPNANDFLSGLNECKCSVTKWNRKCNGAECAFFALWCENLIRSHCTLLFSLKLVLNVKFISLEEKPWFNILFLLLYFSKFSIKIVSGIWTCNDTTTLLAIVWNCFQAQDTQNPFTYFLKTPRSVGCLGK